MRTPASKQKQTRTTQSVASPRRVQMAYTRQNKLPPLDTIILLGNEVTYTWGLDVQNVNYFNGMTHEKETTFSDT